MPRQYLSGGLFPAMVNEQATRQYLGLNGMVNEQSATATAYTLNADPGSYLVSGVATSLTNQRQLIAAAGSYSITGSAALTAATRVLGAAPGSYSITGAPASLILNNGGSTYTLNADAGAYSITGSPAALAATRVIKADAGAYFVTGSDVSLVVVRHYVLQAAPGLYFISGNDAGLSYSGAPTNTSDEYIIQSRRKTRR